MGCEAVRDVIPELAMGVAPGPDRAAALTHIVGCVECRERLRTTAETVDELLLLAPEIDPPAGFEAKVLNSLQNSGRRSRWPLVAAVAAVGMVVAALLGVGFTQWAGSADRQLADRYRGTLEAADGTAFLSAELTMTSGPSVGSAAGHVFAYEGSPSWVFMTVNGVPSQRYRVQIVSEDGTTRHVGVCNVRDGYESWGATVDVPPSSVERLEMRSKDGTAFVAEFT